MKRRLSRFRNEKRGKGKKNLQKEFVKAKQSFDSDPNTKNPNALNSAKEKLELLYEANFKVSLFVREHAGGNTAKVVQNIFLI